MGRYLIIDTQGIPENGTTVFTSRGICLGQTLSEEEALSKFKDVFEAGEKRGRWIWDEFYKGDTVNFNELSKTL